MDALDRTVEVEGFEAEVESDEGLDPLEILIQLEDEGILIEIYF
jgi:hypothetical protein